MNFGLILQILRQCLIFLCADECLVSLATYCTNIRCLNLTNTKGWSDNGLSHLSALKNLRILDLANTNVSDLVFLRYCSQFEQLDVRGCRFVTDESLHGVPQKCPKLRGLFFEKQAGITDQVKKFICVCVF
jgi:hypothetical protein